MPGSTFLQSTISDLRELSGCGFLPELSGKQVAEPRLILVSPAGQALQVGHCVLCPHCRPEFFSMSPSLCLRFSGPTSAPPNNWREK